MQEVCQTGQSAPTLTPSSTFTVRSTSGSNQSPAPLGSAATKDTDMQILSGQHHWSAATDVLIEIHWYTEQTFPALSRLAVRYLGIVTSSVPAERIFSKAGEVVSKKHSRLKGENCKDAVASKQNPDWGKSVNVNFFC